MLRTIFGLKTRPPHNRASGPPAQEVVIEKPQYGLAWFRIRFGMLQLKAYTKGEHVLRFEAAGPSQLSATIRARSLQCAGACRAPASLWIFLASLSSCGARALKYFGTDLASR